MYDPFLPPSVKGLKDVLEIFKEQSDDIRSVPPAVFFEKAILKIFRKFLEKHLCHIQHICKPSSWQIMLNSIFSQISAGPQISTSL